MTLNITNYKFFQKLIRLPFVDAIWLYGSRARKDNRERSDIDIAIVCPGVNEEAWQQILNIIENADTLLKIDCIRFDKLAENEKIRENVLKFKKILFERGSNYMEKEFWQDYFASLGNVLQRLGEAVAHHPDQKKLYRDASIQRFEFCIELYWKVLKKFLAYEKVDTTTPRDVLEKSFQYELIDDDKIWLKMMDDRNRASHVYRENVVEEVFSNIINYYPIMQKTYQMLEKRFARINNITY